MRLSKHRSNGRQIFYLLVLGCSIVLLYFILWRGIHPFKIPSASMEPTLYPHDYIFTLKDGTYQRGDVVVLRDPENSGEYLVKRVVGVAGDVLAIDMGALYINGEYASEPYTMEKAMLYTLRTPVKVPEGEVFVLGDNRNNSDDSHVWQKKTTPIANIVGRVRYIYLPFKRMGRFESYPLINAAGE